MSATEATPLERVQTSYKQLSLAAINLNIASNELVRAISVLNQSLLNLNLGVSAWATITGNEGDDGSWWSRDIGYTLHNGQWGIALRSSSGHYNDPEHESATVWAFNDAPRWMQVEAVGNLPELIEKLIGQAEQTRQKLKHKSHQAMELVAIIEAVTRTEQDWKTKLGTAMRELGLAKDAEALFEPEVEVAVINNELKFKLPKRLQNSFDRDTIPMVLSQLGCPELPFKLIFVRDQKAVTDPSTSGTRK